MTVLLGNAPANYQSLLSGVADVTFVNATSHPVDVAHVFLGGSDDIAAIATRAINRLRVGGMLWLSWAKKSSALHDGVTEDHLRRDVLPLGWVDVKVCAVDADWSGLKFLRRKA